MFDTSGLHELTVRLSDTLPVFVASNNLPREWTGVGPTLLGVLIGGVTSWIGVCISYRLRKRDVYQDLLVPKRFETCAKLRSMLVDFEMTLNAERHGGEFIKSSEKLEDTPPAEKEETGKQRKKVQEQLYELKHFVVSNEMILGRDVTSTWYFHIRALEFLETHLKNPNPPSPHIYTNQAFQKLMPRFVDEISLAIEKSLPGADIKFLTTPEWQSQRIKGQQMARDLIKQAEVENGESQTQE